MGWTTRRRPDLGLEVGDPIAKSHPRAWIQIAAVSREQTKNTMTLFPGLFTKECIATHSIDINKEIIYAYRGARRIEAVTSSPATLEGGRPTFVIMNETHHWKKNNDGHEMDAVIERNATKSKGGAARQLAITNAYEPSEDSVAQRRRETWEEQQAGLAITTGIMYDSLEAPADAGLRPPKRKDDNGLVIEPTEAEVRSHLASVVRGVRGDAWWLDVDGLVNSILDKKNPPSRSRRFWFNQIVAAEDAWADPAAIRRAIDPIVAANRDEPAADQLKVGWQAIMPDDEIVMFFDGSKSDDATGIVGCRISDSYVFTIGVWQKPPGKRGENWLAPRGSVDARVREMFGAFNVVGFFADPSHATDDEDGTRYWDNLIDEWHRDFKDRLKVWPLRSGLNTHSVMFDLASQERQRIFTGDAETFVEDLETRDDVEEYAPTFKIDGHPALIQHMRNARRYPTKYGVSLMKDHRESPHKIDLAVCAVGARMVRRMLLNTDKPEEDRTGEVWGAWDDAADARSGFGKQADHEAAQRRITRRIQQTAGYHGNAFTPVKGTSVV